MNPLNSPRRHRVLPRLVMAVAAAVLSANWVSGQSPGITVSPSGVMLKDGKPYRSIGGNVPFDSWKWFEADETHYLQTFADMKASGIKTVRLSTKGWYAAWKISYLSISDKAAYFAKMDAIVDAAAQNDVGVILLLFWWPSAVSDYYGEFELAASIPGTKTYAAMAQFATDMAVHYKDNPAVVGYDVINEMTLLPDQPNSGQSVTGRWTSEAVQALYANVLPAIRAVDPTRLLSTGGTDARGNQYHMTNYCNWSPDTPAQMSQENDMAHPDPAGVLGIHYYPNSNLATGTNWEVYNALALQRRKPFYAGEFGNGDTTSPATVTTANFNMALSNLMANRVPLMSDWYMGSPQNTEDTVSPTGTGAWMWNAIAQANAQYEYGAWKSLAATTGDWNSAGSWGSGAVPTAADDVYVPTGAAARTLTIAGTAYARNLALGTASTADEVATVEISGSGQLVLGQNSSLTFATTTDGTTPTTVTVNGAHGQLLDNSSRSAILSIKQSTGETKPAIVANTVSAYQMKTGDRANISAQTTQLNLFDGMSVGEGASSAGTIYQTGGIVRIGLDANLAGGTPAGLVLGSGSGTQKYVLSNGTLAASGITGATNAVVDWQAGTISTLNGASMIINSTVDMQLNTSSTHSLHVADANQSMTVNATAKISGTGNLTKSGPGKLTLLGTLSEYSYTGTTSVNDGILLVKNQNALPGWNTAGKVSAAARSASTADGTVAAGTVAFNVGGTGEWTTTDIGTILGTNGRITFGNGAALGIDTSNAPGTVTVSSRITGTKGLTKLGTGTLTLNPTSNSNNYTGMTTVLGGTLQLGTTTNTIIPAASGFDVQGGILDLGGKNITLSGSYSALTDNPSNPPLPWLTQPSRVTFAGGEIRNGTITNNTTTSAVPSIYDAQSGTVSANLAGTAWLWKTTAGTLTLTGNNSYSGGTRIAKGTLILGHANGLGTSGDIEFMNGTLKYATGITTDLSARFKNSYSAINIDTNGQTITFASPIDSSNASGLKKSGSGTLILTATNNAYTGGTWVDEGTLQTSANGVLSGANDLTIKAGGVVDLNGTSQSIGNLYSLAGESASIVNNKSGTQAVLTVSGSNTANFGGVLADNSTGTGTVALNKTGGGRLKLTGINTYTGPTTLTSGTLELASPSGPALNGNLTVNAGWGNWLVTSKDNQFGSNATLNLLGELVLQNTEQTIAMLTGNGVIQNDHLYSPLGAVSGGTAKLTVNNSVADTFNGLIRDNAAGNGKVAFIKTGNGTFSLTNDNSFTGGTTVNAGTLALAGGNGVRTAGAGTLTINSGGTVDASAGVNNFGYVGTNPGTAIPIVINGGLLISNNDNHLNSLTMNSGTVSGGAGGSGLYMGTSNSVAPTITSLANNNPAVISSNITPVNTIGIDVANGSAATDLLISGVITNAYGATGGITKTGNGTLVLTAIGSYTGATTISAGTLQLGDGTSGHDALINNSSSIVNNATLEFRHSGNTFSYPAISGSGNLTKTGNGTLTLNSDNTYTGTTTVNSGTLTLRGSSGWALNGSRAGNEVVVNSGATLTAGYSHQFGFTGTLANITINSGGTFDGSAGHLIGRLTLNGNASVFSTGPSLMLTGGMVTYTGSGSQAASLAQDLWLGDVPGNAVNLTVSVTGTNPAGDLTISGAISGPAGASLTKTGNGMLVLSANNAYAGPTSIQAGTLKLTGSLSASSAVTVDPTATLMGTGFVNGSLTVSSGGTIAPGTSAGTLTVGTTTLSGVYACEINGALADRITSTGSITINPGATLAFSTLSAPTLQSYIIASWAGSLTGTFGNVIGTPAGYAVIYDGSLKQIRLQLLPYNRWLADYGLTGDAAAFDADPDHDGIANGLEFVLGGEPNPANAGSNSAALLPTVSESGGNFVFSFHRKDVSEAGVSLTCQWSNNLTFLSPFSDIPVGAASSVTDGVSVSITEDVPDALTDTINITIPAAKATGGKIFLRLKATQVP